MNGQPTAENATLGLKLDCQNSTIGNCSGPAPGGPPGLWMMVNLTLYALICVAGTVGNGLVIYVVIRSV